MRQVHARVHDGDHLAGAARALPRGEHVHARRGAEAPLLAEEAVVGAPAAGVVAVVRLGVEHAGERSSLATAELTEPWKLTSWVRGSPSTSSSVTSARSRAAARSAAVVPGS